MTHASPHAAPHKFGNQVARVILGLVLGVALVVDSTTALRAQDRNVDPTSNLSSLEKLALDASFLVTPSSAGDPLQPVSIDYVQPYLSPDEHAQKVPRMFAEDRTNGHVPFVFIVADIRPRYRHDLVPVMLVGPLGLFTDKAVPEFIQRGLERRIRNKAAQMPGGTFKLNGQPVELGGREDLVRYLEEKDHARDEDNAITRAANRLKLSVEERQDRVLNELLNAGLGAANGSRTFLFSEWRPSPLMGPEKHFDDVRKYGANSLSHGQIPLVYVPADTPKKAMEGFPAIGRVGAWGIWGSPDLSAADLAQLERSFSTATSDENFREAAYLLGVDDFGGPAELQQLVASTPERAPFAKTAAATPPLTTSAKPTNAKPPINGGDLHGPPLAPVVGGLAPGMHDDGRRDPPIPKPIYSKKGDLPAWQPLSDEEKAKHAREQADFRKRMLAKQKRIEELKKQKAKEDAERFDNNLKILRAWVQEKQEEQTALNERMIAKLKAAESRGDAVTAVVDKFAGDPRIIFTNHTDVVLYVEFTYTGTIDNVSVGEQQGWTLLPSGTDLFGQTPHEFFGLNGKDYNFQILSVRWWAREQDNEWRH